MNKIKSEEDLYDEIDKEYTWRLYEIDTLKGLLQKERNKPKKVAPLAKALIVLSYSHWEGFVKYSTEYFFMYMQHLNLNRKNMSSEFLASCIQHLNDNKKAADATADILRCLTDENFTFQYNLSVLSSAESNLQFDVLRKIASNIALDISSLETKKALLDEIVLRRRNDVAHGDHVFADYSYGVDVCTHVLSLMKEYKDLLQNHISIHGYKNI